MPEHPKVDDLACLACFTGPGSQMVMRERGDGTTAIEQEVTPAMELLGTTPPSARCRRCGSTFDPKELRRWNENELRFLYDRKPDPITERRRIA